MAQINFEKEMNFKMAQDQWREDMEVGPYSEDELDQMMDDLYDGEEMGYWNTD